MSSMTVRTSAAVALAVLVGGVLVVMPTAARQGEAFLWVATAIAALLLRAAGLAPALLFTVAVAGCRWIAAGPDGVTLVFGLHPLILEPLLRRRVPLPLGEAAIGALAGMVDLVWLDVTAAAAPAIVGAHDILLCALFGWAAGSIAAAIEASVGPVRRAAVRRYGTLPPVRRLTEAGAGLIALPLAMGLTFTTDYARTSWQAEARTTTLLAAARADEALADWWTGEAAHYRSIAQPLLDRHYGYFGLPVASEGGPRWLTLGEATESYVASRGGDLLVRSEPNLFVDPPEIERLRRAVAPADAPILLQREGSELLEMVVPIGRDNELMGFAVGHYAPATILRHLPPIMFSRDSVSLHRLSDASTTTLATNMLATPGLIDDVALVRPSGPDTAARLALASARLEIATRLPGGWALDLARPIGTIVRAGVREVAWIPVAAFAVIVLFELAGRFLVKGFVGRLAALPNLSRGWTRRESLADDLAQNLRQRHHELQLKATEESEALARHQAMLASAPVALFALREQADGRLAPSYLSPGLQAIAQRTAADMVSADGWASLVDGDPNLTRVDPARNHYATGEPERRERVLRRPDGSLRRVYEEISIVEPTARPFECVGVWVDIEDRRQAEEKLRRSGHLVALGEMAASMAHELNQPLNAMRLALENLSRRLRSADLPAETRQFVDQRIERLSDQAERASAIVERFRVFGRKAGGDFETMISIEDAVRAAAETIAGQLRTDGIAFEVSGAIGGLMVIGTPGALEQILVNLLANARDAILDRRARFPTVAPKGAPEAVAVAVTASPTEVAIAVRDSGSGIPPEAMEHLFEPFFTTKPIGKGTGLGLSICYGLATALRGDIRACNVDGGAEFRLTLPRACTPERKTDGAPPSMLRPARPTADIAAASSAGIAPGACGPPA
jgi:signal transduction histidine kinase